MTADRPEYVTLAEAAAVVGVSRKTAYEWFATHQHRIPWIETPRARSKDPVKQVAMDAVVAWREDRLARGEPVGAIPPHWCPPPAVPEVPPMPIGLMVWRPF